MSTKIRYKLRNCFLFYDFLYCVQRLFAFHLSATLCGDVFFQLIRFSLFPTQTKRTIRTQIYKKGAGLSQGYRPIPFLKELVLSLQADN